jgi:hypothetical protein
MKENNSVGTVHFLLTIIAVLLFSIFLSVGPEVSNVYYLSCSDYEAKGPSCPAKRYAHQLSYRIFPEKGLVVSSVSTSYENCLIYDKENWQCIRRDEILGINDGKFFSLANPDNFENTEEYLKRNQQYIESNSRNPQVPWFFWYIFSWYAFFRDL